MAGESDNQRVVVVSAELTSLAEQQGVRPGNLGEVLSKGPRGPSDETADMMIEAIYQGRDEVTDRGMA